MSRFLLRWGLALAALVGAPAVARCCSWCCSVTLTLSDEMTSSDVVLIVQLPAKEEGPDSPDPEQAAFEVPRTRFQFVEVLKGKELLGNAEQLEVLYSSEELEGTKLLVTGTTNPELAFNTPVPLSERALEYVRKLPGLPEDPADRLVFFLNYLEDAEVLLARDAYDEFAAAPYAALKELGHWLPHDKLVSWIKDPNTTPGHRRQYLTLLGICGRKDPRPADIAMLEQIISSSGATPTPALDGVIACYLTFVGGKGLPLIEDRFLRRRDCNYSDTYSAIMALRFHGTEEQVIRRERLLVSLRMLLDRPDLADLIIPDLARWQDWSVMERLVELFKEAGPTTTWLRIPVFQYLRVCPLPEASAYMQQLALIDPQAFKKASSLVPLAGSASPISLGPPVPTPQGPMGP